MPRRAVAKHGAVKRPAVAKHVLKRPSQPSPSSNVVFEVTHEGPAWNYERMQKEEHANMLGGRFEITMIWWGCSYAVRPPTHFVNRIVSDTKRLVLLRLGADNNLRCDVLSSSGNRAERGRSKTTRWFEQWKRSFPEQGWDAVTKFFVSTDLGNVLKNTVPGCPVPKPHSPPVVVLQGWKMLSYIYM